MAYYTGKSRTDYLTAGYTVGSGKPIDQLAERTVIDPTPAHASVFADVDRLQWGIMGGWGHPPFTVEMVVADAGTSGGAGSYAAVSTAVTVLLPVPPRVEYVKVRALISGALSVKLTNTHDATGTILYSAAQAGQDTYKEYHSAEYVNATTVVPSGELTTRAMKVSGSSTNNAETSLLTVTVTVTPTDVEPSASGFGGCLWSLTFTPVRDGGRGTWKHGDDADSITIS